MKILKVDVTPSDFKPIKIEILFETKDELINMYNDLCGIDTDFCSDAIADLDRLLQSEVDKL
jgi:hypothetical protein